MRKQKEMKHVPDEELALRAQAGSKEAEEVLVKRYWDIASIEARQYVVPGVEHEDRTMIAISDGLIKAIRTFAEGQGSKFKSWAKLLMRRALIECYRQAMQASEVPRTAMLRIDEGSGIDGDDTTLADVIAGPDDTEREVISRMEAKEAATDLARRQWRAIQDQAEGLGEAARARLVESISAFAREVLSDGEFFDLIDLLATTEGQVSLFRVEASDASDLLSRVLRSYIDLQMLVLTDHAHGYSHDEIATRITIRLRQTEESALVTPELVALILGAVRDEAKLEVAA